MSATEGLVLVAFGGRARSAQSPAGERKGSDPSGVEGPERWDVSRELFPHPGLATLFIREGQKREALATIPLEWHYLMVVWSPSAESGAEDEVDGWVDGWQSWVQGGVGVCKTLMWRIDVRTSDKRPGMPKPTAPGRGGGGQQ